MGDIQSSISAQYSVPSITLTCQICDISGYVIHDNHEQ